MRGVSLNIEWIPEQILNKHDVMDVKNEKAIADIFVKITHETSSNWDIRMLPEKKLKKSEQEIHKLSTDNWSSLFLV